MAINKAQKAILKAKFGEQVYELLIKAENVIVTDSGDSEVSLAEKLTAILSSVGDVSGKVTTLMGEDTTKSARQIAGEVLAAAGKLEYKKVTKLDDINPEETGADKYIYLVPKSAKANDKYDEYMVLDGAVEKVGDWDVDLSDYIQKVDGATADNIVVFTADGKIKDGGKKLSDIKEYSDDEKAKVAASKAITDQLTDNVGTLAAIDAAKVTTWNGKAKLHVGTTQPQDMQNGDIWLQTFSE